jgi:hypothetical protein
VAAVPADLLRQLLVQQVVAEVVVPMQRALLLLFQAHHILLPWGLEEVLLLLLQLPVVVQLSILIQLFLSEGIQAEMLLLIQVVHRVQVVPQHLVL